MAKAQVQFLKVCYFKSIFQISLRSHFNILPVLSAVLPDELVDSLHKPHVAALDVNVDAHIWEGPASGK